MGNILRTSNCKHYELVVVVVLNVIWVRRRGLPELSLKIHLQALGETAGGLHGIYLCIRELTNDFSFAS